MGRAKRDIASGVTGFDDVFGSRRGRVEADVKLLLTGDDDAGNKAHRRLLERYEDEGLAEVLGLMRPHAKEFRASLQAMSLLHNLAGDISSIEISDDHKRARERVLFVSGLTYGNDRDFIVETRHDRMLHFHLLGEGVHKLEKHENIETACGDIYGFSEVNIAKNNRWFTDTSNQCNQCWSIYHRKSKAFGGKTIKELDDFEISPTSSEMRKNQFEREKKSAIASGLLAAIEKGNDVVKEDLDEEAYWDSALRLWEMDMMNEPERVFKSMLGEEAAKDLVKSVEDELKAKTNDYSYYGHEMAYYGPPAEDEVLWSLFTSKDMKAGLKKIRKTQVKTVATGQASSSDITAFGSDAAREFRKHVKDTARKNLPGVVQHVFYSRLSQMHAQQLR